MPVSAAGARAGRVRWRIAILLCLITTVNYIDRQAFAVAGPVISEKFALSNTEFGLIVSAFLFAYALGHLFAGPVIDRLGTRRAFSIAVVAWSLAGIACAAARGFVGFLGLRALLGLSEAANFPAALKAVAEWFPRSERSLAVGIVTVGPGLGALVSPPLLGWLIINFGWQSAFIVPGLAGFAWLWIWLALYRPPASHPGLGEAERQLILAGRDDDAAAPAEGQSPEWRRLLRQREMWGLMLSRFCNDGAFYFYVSWLPLYLAQARGFDIREIALFAWIPFLAADLGSLAGGWAGTRLIDRGLSLDRSRKLLIWSGALLVLLTLPAVRVGSAYVALALIALAMFAIQGKAANLFALPADLYPARLVGTSWGLFGAVGAFGGMFFNAAAGRLSEDFGYAPVFLAVGVTQLLSALFVSWLIPKVEQKAI
ncbi:MAG: MFS transporter [Gammaproteobacteria bacterium]|nr:MAG: MFS transporter [Gammaproteobacteria bacterium]